MNNYERGNNEKGFTPYRKEAEKVISEWFGTSDEKNHSMISALLARIFGTTASTLNKS